MLVHALGSELINAVGKSILSFDFAVTTIFVVISAATGVVVVVLAIVASPFVFCNDMVSDNFCSLAFLIL